MLKPCTHAAVCIISEPNDNNDSDNDSINNRNKKKTWVTESKNLYVRACIYRAYF